MLKKDYLPESMYSLDSNITREALKLGQTVTGVVTIIRMQTGQLLVDLGNGLNGCITYENSTMYPIYQYGNKLTPYVFTLVGKTIRAKVISIGETIELSRKAHMLEALSVLKELDIFQSSVITSFSKLSAFVDVGAGITGRIDPANFSPCMYEDIRDVGIAAGTILSVKNLGYNQHHDTFDVSRVKMLPKAEDYISPNDIVLCKVYKPTDDETGYYTIVNDYFNGIVDSPIKLNYGDTVIGIVKKIVAKGLRIDFIFKK